MRKKTFTRNPEERNVKIADRLCEMGHFGRQTGRGWYSYSGSERAINAVAQSIIDDERSRKGILPRRIYSEEIFATTLDTIVQEGKLFRKMALRSAHLISMSYLLTATASRAKKVARCIIQ